MKKILLGFATVCLGIGANYSSAQIVLSQNFQTATTPALPTGWVTTGSSGTGYPGWKTATGGEAGWGTATGYSLPSHTIYAIIDQWKDTTVSPHNDNTYLHDTLKSPVFDLSAYSGANIGLTYDNFFFNASLTSGGQTETAYVLGSSNGGATWSVIDTVPGLGWGGVWTTHHASLAGLSGANCMIAYTYANGGTGASATAHLLGCALDNIVLQNFSSDSVIVTGISYNSATNGIATNGTPVTFTIQNVGAGISSLNMTYQVDGLTPVAQSFTGLSIAPYGTGTFTFTVPLSGAVAGNNTLIVKAVQVNGAANAAPNDSMITNFALANTNYPRNSLVEEFTSSTCPPCMEFASSFDPLCTALGFDNPTSGSDLNIIKYQMNWPDWSNDASYNSDGALRRSYYNCNSIPEHFIDGTVDNSGWSYPFSSAQDSAFSTEFADAKQPGSFISMSATYYVDTNTHTLSVNVSATPSFTKTGAYHMYVAVCDKHYLNYDNEWGMLNYYNVMREMYPNGNGTAITSFTAGTPVSYINTGVAYTSVNSSACTGLSDTAGLMPHMNSNTFWNNPLLGSELVAWIEQDANKSVMQSIVVPSAIVPVTVSTLSYVTGIKLFPNPANNEANLRFNLAMAGNVTVSVIGYDGKLIANVVSADMPTGTQNVIIHTADIPAGNYIILIQTPSGANAERLTVVK